jgi:hypothetical protein
LGISKIALCIFSIGLASLIDGDALPSDVKGDRLAVMLHMQPRGASVRKRAFALDHLQMHQLGRCGMDRRAARIVVPDPQTTSASIHRPG